jgi:hypothetical protein
MEDKTANGLVLGLVIAGLIGVCFFIYNDKFRSTECPIEHYQKYHQPHNPGVDVRVNPYRYPHRYPQQYPVDPYRHNHYRNTMYYKGYNDAQLSRRMDPRYCNDSRYIQGYNDARYNRGFRIEIR